MAMCLLAGAFSSSSILRRATIVPFFEKRIQGLENQVFGDECRQNSRI